jgi:Helix-turn-helix domain
LKSSAVTLPAPLTVDQAAALLRCAPKTVQARARAGDLPGLKWGEDWIFPAGAFFARLDEIALEEAAERRKPAKPTGQLLDIKAAPGGRGGRRAPPKLPSISA